MTAEPTSKGPYARPWRVGRSIGRTIYDAHGRLIGVMDTPALARLVVEAVNDVGPSSHLNAYDALQALTTPTDEETTR